MPKPSGKILVIRGGAIGDFVLTFPVFAALREQFPQTHLEVLGYPRIAQLALAGGLVDQVQSIEARALAAFFADQGALDSRVCDYFASFAVVVSYLFDPDQIFQANVARCSKAQFIAGPHRPDDALNLHATEVLLKPLERLAIFAADPEPKLRITSPKLQWRTSPSTFSSYATRSGSADSSPGEDSANGDDTDDERDKTRTPQRIALHPGSGSEKKNWPETKWSELLRRLVAETNYELMLIGGEAEGDRLERLAKPLPTARVSIAQNLPLSALALRLHECDFFVGHDSGISHLAAAAGLRGLVLWGETNLQVWRPRSEHFTVMRAEDGLSRLPADRVWAELRAL